MTLEELYAEYYTTLTGYVRMKLDPRDRADTEDLVQEVFAAILRSKAGYVDQGHKPTTWLLKIASNVIVNYYRYKSAVSRVQ
jgi:RNA polymerase sigma factor (sigma-70 family)